jgi:hypothetical protein
MPRSCFDLHTLSRQSLVNFSNGNCLLLTDLHATLTSNTLLCIHRNRLFILHLINIHGADIDALLTAYALVFINLYFVHIDSPFDFLLW